MFTEHVATLAAFISEELSKYPAYTVYDKTYHYN